MTTKFEVGFYTVTLADDGTARVSYTESGNLVFEGPAYDVARLLDEQGASFENAKKVAQRTASKIRRHTRASTHPWEVWTAMQFYDHSDNDKLKNTYWSRHAGYTTQARAERAAAKLAKQFADNDTAKIVEVRQAAV